MLPCWPLVCHLIQGADAHRILEALLRWFHRPPINIRQFPGAEWWWPFKWPTCGPCPPP